MDNKKGIRLKTKEVSLVDNIVSFFKKEPQIDVDRMPSPQNDQKDLSPRSTTPRKKIFNKTPQKVGKINFIKNNNRNADLNNKSMNTLHQLTFNDQVQSFQKLQVKSNLSPSNKVNYVSKPMQDTHFNKLILGASKLSGNQKKNRTPERTFLSENQQFSDIKRLSRVSNEASYKKIKEQLDHYKRLSEQLRRQNVQLKNQNKNLADEVQNLNKKLKSYELTNLNNNHIEVVNLDAPKSPFEKQTKSQSNNRSLMKQSIPILPETPNEYRNKNQLPKIQQMSYMSSNLKYISHENSFVSENSDKDMPNFNKKSNAPQQNENNLQILSPFMQKTMYDDKTTKFQQKNKKPTKQSEPRQQIAFSKTVGYLKGDQPQHQINHRNKNNNPFQEIATQSNKFFFQSNNHSQSNNSFKATSGNKGFPTRQWLTFNESEGSQQISNQASHYENSNAFKKQNPFTRVGNPLEKRNQNSKNEQMLQKLENISKSNSVSKSQRVDQSRTYKFQDFDLNDQGSSYVDFF